VSTVMSVSAIVSVGTVMSVKTKSGIVLWYLSKSGMVMRDDVGVISIV
jgi:hypothetical protein